MRVAIGPWIVLPAIGAAISCGDGSTGPSEQITLLTVGAPRSDNVPADGHKRYAVWVTPGAVYRISLTALTDDVDLYPFDNDGTFRVPSCLIDRTLSYGTVPEDCADVAAGDTMYIVVDGSEVSAARARYTIAVQPVPLADLTLSAPLEDSVANGEATFYRVPVVPGTAYSVSISGLSDSSAIFHVVDDGPGVTLPSAGSPKALRLQALGTSMVLAVDGSKLTNPIGTFVILAAAAPVLSFPIVPTSGPVAARTPTVGWVDARGPSRYRTDALLGGTHTVTILGETGDVDFAVYEDDTYSRRRGCTVRNVRAKECKVVGPSAFFEVSVGPLNRDGAGYIILVW